MNTEMDKVTSVTVTICDGCGALRDRRIGLYCRYGTRKMKKIKKNGKEHVICLDCEEPDKRTVTLTRGS